MRMRSQTLIALSLILTALLLSPACATTTPAVVTEPGVTVTMDVTPSVGMSPLTAVVTGTALNDNRDTTVSGTASLTVRIPDAVPSEIVIGNIPVTVNLPGARVGRQWVWTLPAGGVFKAGSLTVNGVVAPDPAITDGGFLVQMDIPAATATAPGKQQVKWACVITATAPMAGTPLGNMAVGTSDTKVTGRQIALGPTVIKAKP